MTDKEYKIVDGTYYSKDAPDEVIRVLEWARRAGERIHLHYGDPDTGRDWNEEHDIEGYVGRSGGSIKIPILVYNGRSYGGGGILDDRIVKIRRARGGKVLYRHPLHKDPEVAIEPSDLPEYSHNLYLNGDLYAHCNSEGDAKRLAAWMTK